MFKGHKGSKDNRCIPNHMLMHYSMTFCSINSASSGVHTENSQKKNAAKGEGLSDSDNESQNNLI